MTRHLGLVTEQHRVETEVRCDRCAIPIFERAESWGGYAGISFTGSFGWGSSNDGDAYRLDLCDGCFAKLAELFHPYLTGYISGNTRTVCDDGYADQGGGGS